MIVVVADETMIPGRRIELEATHQATAATLRSQAGFVGGRLLHFSGGPYRYLHETTWQSREDWDRFWSGPDYASYRATIDAVLSEPFGLRIHDVRVEA